MMARVLVLACCPMMTSSSGGRVVVPVVGIVAVCGGTGSADAMGFVMVVMVVGRADSTPLSNYTILLG